jgi:hypothetical protein
MQLSTFSASKFTVFVFNILFSVRTWKIMGCAVILFSLWYSYYSFTHTFNIVKEDGIYGIVSESKWHDIVTAQEQVQEADRKARVEATSDNHISQGNKQALSTWNLPVEE